MTQTASTALSNVDKLIIRIVVLIDSEGTY